MRFVVKIEMGNDAMQTEADLAGALRDIIDELEIGTTYGNLRDVNGNTVGTFMIDQS
jgi:phage tail tube protein FII